MHHLYLASMSPRRREILEKQNIQFDPLPLKVSEIPNENLNPLDQIRQISLQKLHAAQNEIKRLPAAKQPYVLLCADTEVVFCGKLLGKPKTPEDAMQTLQRLSGQTHEVTTVIALYESSQNETIEVAVTTMVHFSYLEDAEIKKYVQTGDPMDKAGSYGIQNVPRHFIKSIQGSLENVIGLPSAELLEIFKKQGWSFPKIHEKATPNAALRLLEVQKVIRQASEKVHRDPSWVSLVAVSKTQPVEKISELHAAGQSWFGENYVQEALPKIQFLREKNADVKWHFIGHLQTNKVKDAVGKFQLIHSVGSLELARKIDQQAPLRCHPDFVQDILLQVNLGEETTKSGFSLGEIETAFHEILEFKHILVRGLMAMPPLQNSPEENRVHFQTLRNLLHKLHGTPHPKAKNMIELSMGTSHDFHIAVEEGATIVRVGTSLFGERT